MSRATKIESGVSRSVMAAVMGLCLVSGAAQARDNVLILFADDIGAVNIGRYQMSTSAPPTPNVDQLAAQGVLFRSAWSNPLCSPSRATLMTGRHSFRHWVGMNVGIDNKVLYPGEVTIAEVFKANGFATSLIGKWHLGTSGLNSGSRGPNVAGFDYYAGNLAGAIPDYYSWARTVNGVTANSTTYATTQQVNDALAWINAQTGDWICVIAFNAAHSPFQAPPQNLHTYNLSGLDPSVTPVPFYKATIQALDSEIGRLLAGLGSRAANTHIIFSADNGTPTQVAEAPYDSNKVKGTVYQGGVTVPLIIRSPRVVNPGREVASITGLVDILATASELAGIDPRSAVPESKVLDSVSLVPYLTNPGQASRRQTMYTELFIGNDPTSGTRAIRNQAYKTVQPDANSFEFYSLVPDPLEVDDLTPASTMTAVQRQNFFALRDASTALLATERPRCLPDINADVQLDFFDYLDFVALYSADDAVADYNRDMAVDFFDYLDFVRDYNDGCPGF